MTTMRNTTPNTRAATRPLRSSSEGRTPPASSRCTAGAGRAVGGVLSWSIVSLLGLGVRTGEGRVALCGGPVWRSVVSAGRG
ncbi:hypothetical protein GDO81_029263 [Engystomops pustulosus]|uniref:Uncharacterized protein n=1 Tax=Engystomops pustulosus TaxID=76066 RepID=A0AAV6YC97_ENGPU|nr:hypothetical protein GDO81_029263 [Engystomops pustulosus]